MLKKLRTRFIMITMTFVTIILIAILTGIYLFMAQGERIQASDFMKNVANTEGFPSRNIPPMFIKNHPQNMPKDTPDFIFSPNPSLYANSFIVIINETGEVLLRYFSSDFNIDDESDAVLDFINLTKAQNTSEGIIKINGSEVRFFIKNEPHRQVIVFTDRSNEIATLTRLFWVCVFIGFLSLLGFLVISVILSKWAIKPMEKAWAKQKQFVADASHELKTPLTVIATNADVVMANPTDQIKEQAKWLNYIKTETERMTKLVNDLLYLAKMDDEEILKHKMNFNLSDALMDICLPFECVVFESNKTFNMNIAPDINYYGDEGRIKQLGVILLDNAIKHTNQNGTIDFNVSLDSNKNKILLSVTNTGPGIPEEHHERIFERFYRVDKSRARETGGYGLGLAIAKTIVTQHNGTIHVTSSLEGPTTFSVSLPYKHNKHKWQSPNIWLFF